MEMSSAQKPTYRLIDFRKFLLRKQYMR